MLTLPSPTAEATRLTEPCRTSPAAKTPGTLVSSGNGARAGDVIAGPAGRQVLAREDESLVVAVDALREPIGVRRGTDEDEQGSCSHRLHPAR